MTIMDKSSLLIIAFIVVFVVSAGITYTGVLPKIFDTNEKLKQALIQQHEDEGRAHETVKIINSTLNAIKTHGNDLKQFIRESEKLNMSEQILELSKQHQQVAIDHDLILTNVDNVTSNVSSELNRYGENSIEKLQKIVDTQQKILTAINSTLKSQ